MPAIIANARQLGNFRVLPRRDYVLQSSGHRITVKEIDKKGGEARIYLHSVGRNVWLSISMIRAWYIPVKG